MKMWLMVLCVGAITSDRALADTRRIQVSVALAGNVNQSISVEAASAVFSRP